MTILPVREGTSTTDPIPTSTSLTIDETALQQILDPWERARRTADLVEALQRLSGIVLDLRQQAVRELVHQHREPKARVARLIGVTPTRISQLLNGRTPTSANAGMVA